MKILLSLLVFFPLFGAALLGVIGRRLPRRAVEVLACGSVLASLLMAGLAFFFRGEMKTTVTLWNWFAVDSFSATVSLLYDPLSAIMALMVTFVSALIHLYSVAFMREDEDYVRYFFYLNLFVFAMLVVTLADSLLLLYLGWEGVGFCSYALIGFWYRDPINATAGRKAFIVTRIGDVALATGIALFFATFNQLSITFINANATSLHPEMATVLALLLLGGAVGKSAQLPLVVWLPDAMAGPTPVSALIHAATMVTAGVYLLMRLFPVVALSSTALFVIGLVGALTAFFAACSALSQRDIKRVLAYSTISQMGYLFLAVGAGDIAGSLFHLLSHAFFKALLFLAAGCIIQALHEEHDIFRMGGLRAQLPQVFWLFLAGALSLGAFPLSGGFFSKDRILLAAFIHPEPAFKVLWGLAAAAALLTPLYIFRVLFVAFHGDARRRDPGPLRPLPRGMIGILWPLALLSLFDGLLNLPDIWTGKEWLGQYLSTVPGAVAHLRVSPSLEWAMEIGSGLSALLMIFLSYRLYGRASPAEMKPGWERLFASGFYLDALYLHGIVRPYQALSRFLWTRLDQGWIDWGSDETAHFFLTFSKGLGQWTTGRLSVYLNMILLGFVVVIALLALGGHYF